MIGGLYLLLGASALSLLIGSAGGCAVRGNSADKELAKVRAEHSAALNKAQKDAAVREAQARADERLITRNVQEAADAAHVKATVARAAAAHADARAGRLQRAFDDAVTSLASRGPEAASAAPGSAPAGGAGLVLSDVFGRVEQRGRSCAAALDQARIAGLACERAYDEVAGQLAR